MSNSSERKRRMRAVSVAAAIGAAVTLVVPAAASAQVIGSEEIPGSSEIPGSAEIPGGEAIGGSVADAANGSATINPGDVVSGLLANTGSAIEIVDGLESGSPSAILQGVVHGIQGVVASTGSLAPTQGCNAQTVGGGAGVTSTNHELGRGGPTSFVLRHETYSIPDRIEVFYQGARIHDTGYIGDNTNEGTGSPVVTVPGGAATSVLVRVTGLNNTEWDYTVNCPV